MWKCLFGEKKLVGISEGVYFTEINRLTYDKKDIIGIWHFFENTKTKKRSVKLVCNSKCAKDFVDPYVETWVATGDRAFVRDVKWLN